jgi:hypothetical protein
MAGLALGVYPVAVFPDNPAYLYVALAVLLLTDVAIAISTWIALTTAGVVSVIGYMAVLVAERGRIDIFAPLLGVALVVFIEFFDISTASSRKRSMDRSAAVERLKDVAPGAGIGCIGGLLVLFAGIYGGDGGVIVLGLGASCVVFAYALLAKAARSPLE